MDTKRLVGRLEAHELEKILNNKLSHQYVFPKTPDMQAFAYCKIVNRDGKVNFFLESGALYEGDSNKFYQTRPATEEEVAFALITGVVPNE